MLKQKKNEQYKDLIEKKDSKQIITIVIYKLTLYIKEECDLLALSFGFFISMTKQSDLPLHSTN